MLISLSYNKDKTILYTKQIKNKFGRMKTYPYLCSVKINDRQSLKGFGRYTPLCLLFYY